MAGIVTDAMQTQVAELYVGFFNRAPLAAGMSYWAEKLAAGATPQQLLANEIQFTPEYVNLYGGKTPEQQVSTFFEHVFGRAPLAAGLTYWASKVTATNPFYNVAWDMVNSVYNAGAGVNPDDTALVRNKVEVAKYFSIDLSGTNRATADTAFYGVTKDHATVDAKITEMEQSSGGSFTLTTGADTVDATGNVLVTGLIDAVTPANSTLQAIDTITGNGANDTVRGTYVTSSAGSGSNVDNATGGALINGVENFQIRNTGSGTVTLDADLVSGATNVSSYLSVGAVTVNDLATGAAMTVQGNGTMTSGAVNFDYATASAAVTLNLANGVKMGSNNIVVDPSSGASIGTANAATINSTGVSVNTVNVVDLANATLTSVAINAQASLSGNLLSQATNQVGTAGVVTISGAAEAVTFTAALDNTIATIDASGLTAGAVTATLGTGITSFIGGGGDNVITTAETTATGAVINGGSGTNNTLIIAESNDISTAAKGAQYINFDNLTVNNSQNVSYISGISALTVNALSQKTISGISAALAQAITIAGDQTSSLALTLSSATGTADVVSLDLASATATSNVDIAGLSVAGVETLNIAATTGTAGSFSDVAFGSGGADALTTVNLTGAAGVGLSGTNTALLLTVNGAALTGAAKISGNFVNASVITTGSGDDTITLGTGFATYNSGEGDDTFNATVAQLNTSTNYNTLNGGGGTDTLNIAGAAAITLVDTNFKQLSGIEAIVQADTGANALSVTTGAWFNQNFASGVSYTATTGAEASTLNLSTYTADATISLTSGATTGHSVTVTTGSGDDSVTVAASAFVGASGKLITVSTGSGDDTISVSPKTTTLGINGAVTITGGAGADTITVGTHTNGAASAGGNVQIVVGATDSTTSAFDTVQGLNLGTGSLQADNIDFTGTATVAANATSQAVSGYTAAQLTYSISSGVLTFAGTSAASLSASAAISAVESLSLANTATVVFVNNGNSYVFNNNTSGDALVQLVGVTTVASLSASATDTSNALFIS